MKNKSHQAHFVLKKKNANIVATRSLDARFYPSDPFMFV